MVPIPEESVLWVNPILGFPWAAYLCPWTLFFKKIFCLLYNQVKRYDIHLFCCRYGRKQSSPFVQQPATLTSLPFVELCDSSFRVIYNIFFCLFIWLRRTFLTSRNQVYYFQTIIFILKDTWINFSCLCGTLSVLYLHNNWICDCIIALVKK